MSNITNRALEKRCNRADVAYTQLQKQHGDVSRVNNRESIQMKRFRPAGLTMWNAIAHFLVFTSSIERENYTAAYGERWRNGRSTELGSLRLSRLIMDFVYIREEEGERGRRFSAHVYTYLRFILYHHHIVIIIIIRKTYT